MAPAKLLGFILLLFVCLKFTQSSKTKKTIKIHVPYYVKHVHHYKKVYVPKVQVVKHEHLHKKEHEHHHHHDHHDHGHHHHHGYDKSSDGGYYEDYDSYYDDIDQRSYNDATIKRLPKSRQKLGYRAVAGAIASDDDWRDSSSSSSEELSSSEEDDYITGPEGEGTRPAPIPNTLRSKPRYVPKFRRTIIKRSDSLPTAQTTLIIAPSVTSLPKKIIARVPS